MFPKLFKKLLEISAINVVSSPGFISYLPKGFKYVLSHNLDINILHDSLKRNSYNNLFINNTITITTIGAIRDYDQNFQLMSALANKANYMIKFIGAPGKAGTKLKKDAEKCNIQNVEFIGFYDKKDEPDLIKDADFLNIYYPKISTHTSALSNRFYNALIFKKPMIVLKDSIQGEYVLKYNLGIAIEDCSDLDKQIKNYCSNFQETEFIQNCNKLLEKFKEDYEAFKNQVVHFFN
jgi:hypothetical protein